MSSERRGLRAFALGLLFLGAACIHPPSPAVSDPLPAPDPSDVDAVLVLIGDAGAALPGASPVLDHARRRIERWAGALDRDSAVAVVFLGDLVYPGGVRDLTRPSYALDTLHLRAQLDVLSGPNASERAAAYFIAGNHDWGNRPGPIGRQRVQNLDRALGETRRSGVDVALLPEPGRIGPVTRDLGRHARIVFLDTHAWLRTEADSLRARALAGLERELVGTERTVVFAVHHPSVSGGPHGEGTTFGRGLGMLWLLRKTGSVVQDLNARPYEGLIESLGEVFERAGAPFVHAAGHDHSLQVIRGSGPRFAEWNLVSGAASKLSGLTEVPGMIFGRASPGYMTLYFLRDGGVLLFVDATANWFLSCAGRPRCMESARAVFRTVYSARLR